MTPAPLPGLELAGRYYREIVRPLLDQCAPGLPHSAALLGWGSDVLGYDSTRSTDHNWGPRLQLFLRPAHASEADQLATALNERLPDTFLGWPTRFPDVSQPGWPAKHWVTVAELGEWLISQLGFDPRAGVTLADWLATPTQLLAELTAGAVFHDGLSGSEPAGLHQARQAITWYPEDVWRYLLACQWRRISQEEAFPGRCAEADDDLGSIVITARLTRDLMRLALLMRRRYPPYSKWLGTAFARTGPSELGARLKAALLASSWTDRECEFGAACIEAAALHNELHLTEPIEPVVSPFYDRPYQIIHAERFEHALRQSITDDRLRELPLIGGVDHFIDSTDAMAQAAIRRASIAELLDG
jgi:uncharacterized protein DUF4037